MLPEFLEYGFMHRAFAVGLVTALICPAIGVFLIPRRLSLIADTLAHVALAGVALGLLVGLSPIVGALVVSVGGVTTSFYADTPSGGTIVLIAVGLFAVTAVVTGLTRRRRLGTAPST